MNDLTKFKVDIKPERYCSFDINTMKMESDIKYNVTVINLDTKKGENVVVDNARESKRAVELLMESLDE